MKLCSVPKFIVLNIKLSSPLTLAFVLKNNFFEVRQSVAISCPQSKYVSAEFRSRTIKLHFSSLNIFSYIYIFQVFVSCFY